MNKTTIDSTQITNLFDNLNKEIKGGLLQKGLLKGGKVLQQKTREVMLQKMPNASTAKGNNKKPMTESIRVINDRQMNEVIVSIMSNYLNIFFESGTKERYLKRTGAKDRERGYQSGDKRYLYRKKGKEGRYKSGEYRGKIKPLNFFRDARNQSENDIIRAIEEEVMNQLNKIFKS